MKHSHTPLVTLLIGALLTAGFSVASAQSDTTRSNQKPVVITPPAVKDGSNWSRAPFPAQRSQDDVKAPDGKAIDDLPPNTPATNTEAPVPAPQVAILQPGTAPAATADATLTPTGRTHAAVATSLDAATFAPTLRSSTFASREQVLSDLDARITSTESALGSIRGNARQMSADARRAFDAANDEVKSAAKALRKSVNSARKANEQNWDAARTQLAADFDAYAAALSRLDTTAGATVTTP